MSHEKKENPLALVGEKSPWYGDGLRFKCTGCGKCCTGAPGAVWVSDEEIEKMSSFLNISVDQFLKRFTRLIDGRRSLVEDSKSYDCVFLRGSRCMLYEVRPQQCRTYPWWPSILRSQEEWNEEKKWCEGIDHSAGEIFTAEEIDRCTKSHLK